VTAETGNPRIREGDPPPETAPHTVRVPVNIHRWDDISFLHWAFDPDDIAPLVPQEATLLTHEGKAWVGVTPFFIRVRPPGVPVSPPGWSFPETNVRTYVAGPDGRDGLWFFRMEVTAAWFAAALRLVGLPYVRQRMRVDREDGRFVYKSEARDSQGGHDIVLRPGEPLDPPSGGPLERFLTARWGAYHREGPLLLYSPVEHPAWDLHTAAVENCDVDGLFRAAGLPTPVESPLVHYSTGVTVKVGPPQKVT
jgi:uncharacterized protein